MYDIEYTKPFKRRIKKLSKKYANIKRDFTAFLDDLEQGNLPGDEIQGYHGKVYKARISSSDQKKGKSGGFRFIYYVVLDDGTVYMMTAYSKSTQTDLSKQERQEIKNFIASQ